MSYSGRGGSSYGGRTRRSTGKRKSSRKSGPINISDYPYSTWALDGDGKAVYGRAFKTKQGAVSKGTSLVKDDSLKKVFVRTFKKGKLTNVTNLKGK